MPQRKVDLTGRRFGRWTVLHEAPPRPAAPGRGKTYWVVRCDCGVQRELHMGALRSGRSTSCGCYAKEVAAALLAARAGNKASNWAGDQVGYSGAHQRLRRERGGASEHSCTDCGAAAGHWAYGHKCPDERTEGSLKFCLHPEHYDPLCVPCHSARDKDTRIGGREYRAERDQSSFAM